MRTLLLSPNVLVDQCFLQPGVTVVSDFDGVFEYWLIYSVFCFCCCLSTNTGKLLVFLHISSQSLLLQDSKASFDFATTTAPA